MSGRSRCNHFRHTENVMHISTENNASGRVSWAKFAARKKKETEHTHDTTQNDMTRFLRICSMHLFIFVSSGKKIFFDKTENSVETSYAEEWAYEKCVFFFKSDYIKMDQLLTFSLCSFRAFWYDNATLNPLSIRYCLRIKYDYIQTDL